MGDCRAFRATPDHTDQRSLEHALCYEHSLPEGMYAIQWVKYLS